jgi:hypothetical protein
MPANDAAAARDGERVFVVERRIRDVDGHAAGGQIGLAQRFEGHGVLASDECGDGHVRFVYERWARGKDRFSGLAILNYFLTVFARY